MTESKYTQTLFVFGANLGGHHGKGAAAHAVVQWGAIQGIGIGPQGSAYAIPTKDWSMRPLKLKVIGQYVTDFIAYARRHPHIRFQVTRVGCGLAEYTEEQIAPLFTGAPGNCSLPPGWRTL